VDAYHEATKNHEDREENSVQKPFVFFVKRRAFVMKA